MLPVPVPYRPATEPLGHTAPLDYQATFPLLGLPLEIRSNSEVVLDIAERAFGRWRALDIPTEITPHPLRVSVVLHSTQPGLLSPSPIRAFSYRVHSGYLLASCEDNMLVAHPASGEALAFLTPQLVANEAHFRYNVLESLALYLLSKYDRTALHAGAVMRNGRALLLVGSSGAGKSSLCYACLQRGFSLLSEDVVYVALSPALRLWGNPHALHLLPDSPGLFPELSSVPAQIQANGKLKIAIDVAEQFGARRLCLYAEDATLCLLERHRGMESTLTPLTAQEAVDAMTADIESGYDLGVQLEGVFERVARGGAYRLQMGREIESAVGILEGLTRVTIGD
ncbi:MAG: hypothetical protein H0T73_05125 [Ardenticatenales bacterium]|nr:hypothetical protein [Ardenticatenales bacterium]